MAGARISLRERTWRLLHRVKDYVDDGVDIDYPATAGRSDAQHSSGCKLVAPSSKYRGEQTDALRLSSVRSFFSSLRGRLRHSQVVILKSVKASPSLVL